MKVIALNGSPRLIGNTSYAVTLILDEFAKEGLETEHIQMYGSAMTPCNDCGSCGIRGDGRCINEDDDMNAYLEKLTGADAVILAAPSYYGGIPGQMRILLERISLASSTCAAGNPLAHKTGGAIAVQGRDGGLSSYSEMVNFMLVNRMTVCGSTPLTILTGRKPSEVLNDTAGVSAVKGLAREMIRALTEKRD
ncbi:MAG: flavodoxin family protein [Methanomassiliicoccaceae archaeon]|jgi:multimeric flavodoxin WrbA|nr:flavodoxin family protein [Methanomassiliicoccaceae archaeon]